MSYSKIIFGKDIFDLSLSDVETYFQTVREENLHLEFKSNTEKGGSQKDKEKIVIKGICAMLNSEGGVLIWGAPEEIKNESGKNTAIGALTFFDTELDKDRIINKISDVISPMPIGVKAHFIKKGEKSIVIFEVDKSLERPHQYDNIYYVRIDGQTRPAPHYLVKALILSKDYPNVRGHIRLVDIREGEDYDYIFTFRNLVYNTSVFNNEINSYSRLVVQPPGNLFVKSQFQGNSYLNELNILANGRPEMFDFEVSIHKNKLNENIAIILQFGGEKSPAKMSLYNYNFSNNLQYGYVQDEDLYLISKKENQLPTDFQDGTDDERILSLLTI